MVERGSGERIDLGGCGEAAMGSGDRIIIKTPTGGGFGPVSERTK